LEARWCCGPPQGQAKVKVEVEAKAKAKAKAEAARLEVSVRGKRIREDPVLTLISS
jgi:hypothetical protein